MILKKDARVYKEHISYLAKAYMLRNNYKKFEENNLVLSITAFFQDKRRRDVANLTQHIPDALNQVWYNDDSQIIELIVKKYIDRMNPRLILELKEINRNY